MVRLGSILMASGLPLAAQCSMCRTAAASQGPHAAHAMNVAIIILLVPAVTLFSGVFLLAFRYGKAADEDAREVER